MPISVEASALPVVTELGGKYGLDVLIVRSEDDSNACEASLDRVRIVHMTKTEVRCPIHSVQVAC